MYRHNICPNRGISEKKFVREIIKSIIYVSKGGQAPHTLLPCFMWMSAVVRHTGSTKIEMYFIS